MSDNISTRDDDNTLSVRGFPNERSNKMKTNEIRTTEAAVLKKALRKFCKKWRDTDETEFPKAMMTLVQMNKNEATINCGGEWMSFTYTDCLADAILKDEGFKAIMEQNNATAHKERNNFGTIQIRIHYCDEPKQETSSEEETAPAEVNSDEIESKEEDRPRIRVSYWSDDTLTEVVQKTVVGHITFCDNKATFEEAGHLVVIPCRLLILIQALDR